MVAGRCRSQPEYLLGVCLNVNDLNYCNIYKNNAEGESELKKEYKKVNNCFWKWPCISANSKMPAINLTSAGYWEMRQLKFERNQHAWNCTCSCSDLYTVACIAAYPSLLETDKSVENEE